MRRIFSDPAVVVLRTDLDVVSKRFAVKIEVGLLDFDHVSLCARDDDADQQFVISSEAYQTKVN